MEKLMSLALKILVKLLSLWRREVGLVNLWHGETMDYSQVRMGGLKSIRFFGDFNGDGYLDLIGIHKDGVKVVLNNLGDRENGIPSDLLKEIKVSNYKTLEIDYGSISHGGEKVFYMMDIIKKQWK